VDFTRLHQFNEGLIVSSGCPGGVIAAPIRQGNMVEVERRMAFLKDVFGDRFVMEVMPHQIPECPNLARTEATLAARYGVPMIATQDAHYARAEDSVSHDHFLCIQTKGLISDPNHFHFDTREYYLKTREEMRRAYERYTPLLQPAEVEAALDNTLWLADRCRGTVPIATPGAYLVAPPLPAGLSTYEEWLADACRKGSRWRFGMEVENLPEDYRRRLEHEYQVITGAGFAKYFALVEDILHWCRDHDILTGPGRGSVGGSLVAYLLGIHEANPIEYGLDFSRFLNAGRLGLDENGKPVEGGVRELPDIDMDFPDFDRPRIIEYLRGKYGDECVGHISTRSTLKGRSTMADLCRVMEIPTHEYEPVSALVTQGANEEADEAQGIIPVLEGHPVGRAFCERHPGFLDVARGVEGNTRNTGMHASGIVVSSVPLAQVVPVETVGGDNGRRVPIIAYDMKGAEAVGLVKVDVLGLTALSMVSQACRNAGIRAGEIDVKDPAVFEAFTNRRFAGVFQYDTSAAREVSAGFSFRNVLDVGVITALDRPGPMESGLARDFVERASGRSKWESVHPVYDEVFRETYGVPVYQEQIEALVRGVGYDAKQSNAFRRKVSKKLGLADEEARFKKSFIERGMDFTRVEQLWEKIVGFASYAFNKCVDVETEIALCDGGYKRAGDLRLHDVIVNGTERGRRGGQIKWVFPVQYKPGVELIFDDGSHVICSREHRWCGPRGEPVTTNDLIEERGVVLQSTAEDVGRDWGYAQRRLTTWRSVGVRPMVDIEVEAPHYFALYNGLLSHNSHSTEYGLLAIWTMWLKVHHPAAFFAAYLAVESDVEKQYRLAGEARRCGIPVLPPDVNLSDKGFSLVREGDHFTIRGAARDVKGVGDVAAQAIVVRKPYDTLGDFCRKASANTEEGRGATSAVFEVLARCGGLRSLVAHDRLLVANAKTIWAGVRAGWDPVIASNAADIVPDYTPEQSLRVAGMVYPLYQDAEGRSLYDVVHKKMQRMGVAKVLRASDVAGLPLGAAALVLGRLAQARVFSDHGVKTMRLHLTDSDGDEVIARMDADMATRAAALVSGAGTTGNIFMAYLRVGDGGRTWVEALWDVTDATDWPEGQVPDATLRWLLDPPKTRPQSPADVMSGKEEGYLIEAQGRVLRVAKVRGRKGTDYLMVTLAAQKGALRFFVFTNKLRDRRSLDVMTEGAEVAVPLRRMGRDACCLADDRVAQKITLEAR
jgi:DNA polymerase III alpha subunit